MGLALLKDSNFKMNEEQPKVADKLYSISETAVMIGISEPTLFNYIKNESIESHKINGNTRFTKKAIYDYLRKVSSSNTTDKELDLFIEENISKKDKKK